MIEKIREAQQHPMWVQELNNFKDHAIESVALADKLTLKVLKMMDNILESGSTLYNAHVENYSTTRVIHYPAYTGPIDDRQMRIGEHSDYGTIT